MLEEVAKLPPVYGALYLGMAAVIAWRVALTWWKIRQAEQDHAFKKELLAQNYSIADIERLLQNGKPQAPLLMLSFPMASAAPRVGPPQNCAGVCSSESAAPAAEAAPQGGMSFGNWYEQQFAGIPFVFQGLIWLLYGFLWIPFCYSMRQHGRPAIAVRAKTTSVLPAFVGAAFFVAVLFPSISLLVHVSSSDSKPIRSQGEVLAPERWVVPVEAGQEGSCRVALGHDHFAQSGNVELTAVVIGQSNLAGKLEVETKPGHLYVCNGSSSSILVNLRAMEGTGDFTVQVTAVDKLNKRAATIFTVQVRPAAPKPARPRSS